MLVISMLKKYDCATARFCFSVPKLMFYMCLDTCCSHFLTIIAGVDLHFKHESKLPVCRTWGLNPGRRGARRVSKPIHQLTIEMVYTEKMATTWFKHILFHLT